MTLLRRRRRVWSSLAVVLLFCSAMASVMTRVPSSAAKSQIIDSVLGAIEFCHYESDSTAGGSSPPGLPKAPHCPACLLIGAMALIGLAVLTALPTDVRPGLRVCIARLLTLPSPIRVGGVGSRAPPIMA